MKSVGDNTSHLISNKCRSKSRRTPLQPHRVGHWTWNRIGGVLFAQTEITVSGSFAQETGYVDEYVAAETGLKVYGLIDAKVYIMALSLF